MRQVCEQIGRQPNRRCSPRRIGAYSLMPGFVPPVLLAALIHWQEFSTARRISDWPAASVENQRISRGRSAYHLCPALMYL